MLPQISDVLPDRFDKSGAGRSFAEPGFGSFVTAVLARLKDGWSLLTSAKATIPVHDEILLRTTDGWSFLPSAAGNALPIADVPAAMRSIDALAAGRAFPETRRRKRVLLLVSDEIALAEFVTLPAMPPAELNRQIGVRIERLSPFLEDETVSIASRTAVSGDNFNMAIAVIEKSAIDPVFQRLDDLNCDLAGIGIVSVDRILFASPFEKVTDQGWAGRWMTLPAIARTALLGLALVLSVFAAVLSYNKARADLLQADAAVASEQLGQRARLAEQDKAISRMQLANQAVLGGLEQLSATLPDTAWLDLYRLEDGMLSLTVYAPSANDTRALVQSLPGMSNVTFDGPITRDANAKIERFVISGQIDPARQAIVP